LTLPEPHERLKAVFWLSAGAIVRRDQGGGGVPRGSELRAIRARRHVVTDTRRRRRAIALRRLPGVSMIRRGLFGALARLRQCS
jgi:hypothetical protein